ncbi:peptidylprolyl isomerase [Flavobacterium saccharophilum]|uniref:Uncharacterized protein n=1 Tax=Flavobacterium saccharophilum TaxID=29534 RepID=A0A1M7LB98_9FLAO|nr:hypothetical protein [Flavobacterium saccharophilum]SHM75389.1 hypothetical protein SAMN05444366_4043 [Flavobacterium saccharophilum]
MNKIKLALLLAAIFIFIVSIALGGRSLTFYFKNKEMFQNPQSYQKEFVVIDSTYTKTVGQKNKKVLTYGLSKKFDNYKTIFDLNIPDGSAVIENNISVEPIADTLNQTQINYYAWVNKQKEKGYICNEDEKSIQDNWIFSDQILYIRASIVMIVFSLGIFYWLKAYRIFMKK